VASMNPCPCGYRGSRTADCRCDDVAVAKYVAKLSGPLLDRIDLQIEVGRVAFDEMIQHQQSEPSTSIRARVEDARIRQRQRYKEAGVFCNAELPTNGVREHCALGPDAMALLSRACAQRHFSARALDRIARVARSIADLENEQTISSQHVAEAIQYRSLERLDRRAA